MSSSTASSPSFISSTYFIQENTVADIKKAETQNSKSWKLTGKWKLQSKMLVVFPLWLPLALHQLVLKGFIFQYLSFTLPKQRIMLIQITGLLARRSNIIHPKEINIAKTKPINNNHQAPARSAKNLFPLPCKSIAFIRYSMPCFQSERWGQYNIYLK